MKNLQFLGLVIASVVALAPTAGYGDSRLGQKVDDFQLQSHLGRDWSLSDFDDKKIVVLAFLGTECPLVKLYGPRLSEMREEFADQGVEFLGINSNTQDSLTEMRNFVDRYDIKFPMLKDLGNVVADAVKAERTPEIFVLDSNREVRYHGRIDDEYEVGFQNGRPEKTELRDAIEQLLAGDPVTTPETKVVGCHIGRVSKVEPTGDVTFSKQISRIFNKRCVECHRQDQLAPFTLDNYEDVLGWEDTILEVIADNRMPPWYANPDHGVFSNDARLTDEEKELIRNWVANGMPEGDPADLPEKVAFGDGWRIPEPDQILYMSDEPYQVPAHGVVDYQYFTVDPQWDEDKFVYATEGRPGNTNVVHHMSVFIVPPGTKARRGVLGNYVPGGSAVRLDQGLAIRIPKGCQILFQIHYTPNGHATEDRSSIGVCFLDETDVKQVLATRMARNGRFEIPANADAHEVIAECYITRDERLICMTPHMHLRGDKFRFEAVYPNGEREILLDVPSYDFNWQQTFYLAEPKLLPRGTSVRCTGIFNNSANNPVNPNPNADVRWGDQSYDEMLVGFFHTVPVEKNEAQFLESSNVRFDPTGVWVWGRNGRIPRGRMTLNLNGNRLTGTATVGGGKRQVENAVIRGDQLEFTITYSESRIMLEFKGKMKPDGKITGHVRQVKIRDGQKLGPFPWKSSRKR